MTGALTEAAALIDGAGSIDDEARLIRSIKAHIAKGEQYHERGDQHFISAGLELKQLKAEHAGTWAEWEELLKTKIGIGKSRASELMQIADGTKTVEGIREATAEKVRQIRARKSSPVRTGENADDPEASAEATKAKFAKSETAPEKHCKGRKQPTSRPAQWLAAATAAVEALQVLQELQSEYEDWRSTLPENLQGSALAEKLDAVCDLDIASALSAAEEAEGLELPLGFGRD
jgi:hypothetical protein